MPESARRVRQQKREALAQEQIIDLVDASSSTKETQIRVNTLINEGHDKLEAGDPEGALRIFQRARAKGLAHTTANNQLKTERILAMAIADALHQQAKFEQSIVERDRAFELDAQVKTGTAASKQQERDNLENALFKATEQRIEEGCTASNSGDAQAALAHFEQAWVYGKRLGHDHVRTTVERTCLMNAGASLTSLGKYKKAIKKLKRCLAQSMAVRNAKLAAESRVWLHMALLGATAERVGIAVKPKAAKSEASTMPAGTEVGDASAEVGDTDGAPKTTARSPSPTAGANGAADDGTRLGGKASSSANALDVEALSVGELRELIARAHLSSADCVEKAELRARAREALIKEAPVKGAMDAPEADETAEERASALSKMAEAAEDAHDEPLIAASVLHFFRTPQAHVDALVLCEKMQRDSAEVWCRRLRAAVREHT